MVFKLAPQDRRKAACSRSSFVVEENVNDPVSSYILLPEGVTTYDAMFFLLSAV